MDNEIMNLTYKFMKENYDYVYLKAMLELAAKSGQNTTLFIGSSHALNSIDAYCFDNAVNVSMHTQDIFWDSMCIQRVLEKCQETTEIKRCFLVFGYYILFQDLSRGENVGKQMMSTVYYPLFKTLHNYKGTMDFDLWSRYKISDENVIEQVEINAVKMLEKRKNYYNDFRVRTPFFDFKGRKWYELSEEERKEYGRLRAEAHNKQYKFKDSFVENVEILKRCISTLLDKGIAPTIIIPPFSKEYNLFVNMQMKQEVKDMLSQLQDTEVVDFNENDVGIVTEDFLDTDHMNGRGAYKLSMYLAERYECI